MQKIKVKKNNFYPITDAKLIQNVSKKCIHSIIKAILIFVIFGKKVAILASFESRFTRFWRYLKELNC